MASEEPVYKIHSLVRKVQTRSHRQKAAGRHRFVQRLGGGDVTIRRARPATITRSKLKQHIQEFRTAVKEGRIEVRTMTRQLVDIFADEFHLATKTPSVSPAPKPPMDSAANDKTYGGSVGEHRPMYPDSLAQSQVAPSPSVNRPMLGSDAAPVVGAGDPALLRAAEARSAAEAGASGDEDGDGGDP